MAKYLPPSEWVKTLSKEEAEFALVRLDPSVERLLRRPPQQGKRDIREMLLAQLNEMDTSKPAGRLQLDGLKSAVRRNRNTAVGKSAGLTSRSFQLSSSSIKQLDEMASAIKEKKSHVIAIALADLYEGFKARKRSITTERERLELLLGSLKLKVGDLEKAMAERDAAESMIKTVTDQVCRLILREEAVRRAADKYPTESEIKTAGESEKKGRRAEVHRLVERYIEETISMSDSEGDDVADDISEWLRTASEENKEN